MFLGEQGRWGKFFSVLQKKDSTVAEQLSNFVRKKKWKTWLYTHNSIPGVSYISEIGRQLQKSQGVILIASQSSMASSQVTAEVIRAYEENKKILPILVGITHADLQLRQEEWRQALSSTTSFSHDESNIERTEHAILLFLTSLSDSAEQVQNTNFAYTDGLKQEIIDRDNSDDFSSSIRQYFRNINRAIERLTQEQLRVLMTLKRTRRARILGCAGSGKTLVAAEKAIRMASAGLKTLILCHNPYLARYFESLVSDSLVEIHHFTSWVQLDSRPSSSNQSEAWTTFHEPDQATLDNAFDVITSVGFEKFDAIVVDEAQDFRDEWWLLVEAALLDAERSFLYIFHDDNQSLLPFRSKYPKTETVADLSRNCRNSGEVFKLIKYLYAQGSRSGGGVAGCWLGGAYSSWRRRVEVWAASFI